MAWMVLGFCVFSFGFALLLVFVGALSGNRADLLAYELVELSSAAAVGKLAARRTRRRLLLAEKAKFALGAVLVSRLIGSLFFLMLLAYTGEPNPVETLLRNWSLDPDSPGARSDPLLWLMALDFVLSVFLILIAVGWGARAEVRMQGFLVSRRLSGDVPE
ncbi:hypothetical protein [Tabrizicola sp.]|uniref:hypothetical protein n=1 Tax=Tabrizicola sp. TaxID=2005166 RepID=UPI003F40E3C5